MLYEVITFRFGYQGRINDSVFDTDSNPLFAERLNAFGGIYNTGHFGHGPRQLQALSHPYPVRVEDSRITSYNVCYTKLLRRDEISRLTRRIEDLTKLVETKVAPRRAPSRKASNRRTASRVKAS